MLDSFRPAINPASRDLHMDPLHARLGQVADARRQQRARLAEQVAAARGRDETFTPRVNSASTALAKGRAPLSEMTNLRAPPKAEPTPELEQCTPAVVARSRQLVAAGAREQSHRTADIRRRVQALWAAHAESSDMSAAVVRHVLRDIGLSTDDALLMKFLAALGTGPGGYVEYGRFSKVFAAVLRSATGAEGHHSPAPAPAASAPCPAPRAVRAPSPASPRPTAAHPAPAAAAPRDTLRGSKPRSAPRGPSRSPSPSCPVPFGAAARVASPVPREQPLPRAATELDGCTFAPRLDAHRRPSPALPPDAPGFSDAVTRMARGRAAAPVRFEESLRGGRPPSTARAAATTPRPFQLRAGARAREHAPLMFVDVDIAPGRKGRIGVHPGDTAAALARDFAATHRLDPGMRRQLGQLLGQEMQRTLGTPLGGAAAPSRGPGAPSASPSHRESPAGHRAQDHGAWSGAGAADGFRPPSPPASLDAPRTLWV